MSSYQLPEDQDYIEVLHSHDFQEDWDDAGPTSSRRLSTSRQSKQPLPPSSRSEKSRGKRKGSKSTTTTTQSGSDTEREPSKMSPRTSKHSSSSSSRKDKSTSSTKTKKTDDWTEVTEPDERRRIQNRIAQRKFREKAREQKDRAARDAQNQQYAGSAYQIPDADDFTLDDGGDLSGLPWGGLNMRHVVARGHASASAGQHTHSHNSSSSIIHTTASSGPVDQMVYGMNPYGYAAVGQPGLDGSGGSDVYSAGYASPYQGYYDFDPALGDHSAHGQGM